MYEIKVLEFKRIDSIISDVKRHLSYSHIHVVLRKTQVQLIMPRLPQSSFLRMREFIKSRNIWEKEDPSCI